MEVEYAMTKIESTWMGEPLSSYNKEELIEIIEAMGKMLEEERKLHQHSLDILGRR